MTAEQILKAKCPGDIFPNDLSKCKHLFRELTKKFHPDVYKAKNAEDVFQKINELYDKAQQEIEEDTWTKTNFIRLSTIKGRRLDITYKYRRVFELGEYLVCNSVIVYVLNKGNDKYADNALKMINSLEFRNGKMEELKNFFPKIRSEHTLKDGRRCLVIEKSMDMYPLRAIYDYYNEKIYDKHVAWIINRLSNLACYLQFSNLTHNAINLDNCFISPTKHAVAIYGGWWYSVNEGEKMIGTTTDIFNVMPITSKNSKLSNITTDLEAIKLLGRQLLGESQPRKLMLDKAIPEPLLQFMTDGSDKSAFDEFSKYNKLLDDAYGKRVFIQMDIKDKDIYKID